MKSKAAKKIRKAVRGEIGKGFQSLNKIIRKKPWYIPKFLWVLPLLILFEKRYIKYFYKHL